MHVKSEVFVSALPSPHPSIETWFHATTVDFGTRMRGGGTRRSSCSFRACSGDEARSVPACRNMGAARSRFENYNSVSFRAKPIQRTGMD